ncbi:MAG: 30S ribosomal protein S17 [Spirochaetales bacterium]|nr:30S ribosomal protein S17 [Spirochaetales bacterium]
MSDKTVLKKRYSGYVVSDKMDKTITVAVKTKKLHPLYKKYVSHTKKVKAHDAENSANEGDYVEVIECRPYSKDKCWRLVRIIERAR